MSKKNHAETEKENADSVETPAKKKVYSLMFRENAPFECSVGGERVLFRAHERNPWFPEKYRNGVPQEFVEHKDFVTLRKYFVITEKR